MTFLICGKNYCHGSTLEHGRGREKLALTHHKQILRTGLKLHRHRDDKATSSSDTPERDKKKKKKNSGKGLLGDHLPFSVTELKKAPSYLLSGINGEHEANTRPQSTAIK